MRHVSPQFAENFACPRCGAPVAWLGSWRRDHNSPDGWSFVRKPWEVTLKERRSPQDRQVTQMEPTGAYEVSTKQAWRHVVTLQCSRCSWCGNESLASKKPNTDDGLRASRKYHSFYLDDEDTDVPAGTADATGGFTR